MADSPYIRAELVWMNNNPNTQPPSRLDSGKNRRRSPKRTPRAAARRVTAGIGLFLLLALAGCEGPTQKQPATPMVTISAAGDVTEGNPLKFLVRADPAPPADLPVGVTIKPAGCELTEAPTSVTIDAGKTEATLTVPTSGAGVGADGCSVTATIADGEGYRVGATAASVSATVTRDPTGETGPMQPVVTIMATAVTVTAGSPVSFTLTAEPAPADDLTVKVSWSQSPQSGSLLAKIPQQTVTISASSGTATLSEETIADEPSGSVTVKVEADSGYTVGTPSSATVAVTGGGTATPGGGGGGGGGAPAGPSGCQTQDPCPVVTVKANASSVIEGSSVSFTLTAKPAPQSAITVNLKWSSVGTPENEPQSVEMSTTGTATFSATAVDDNEPATYKGSISMEVHVRIGVGYVVGHPFFANVTIVDND